MKQLNEVVKLSEEQLENVVGGKGKVFKCTAESTEQKITYSLCAFLGLVPLGGFIYKIGKTIYNKVK